MKRASTLRRLPDGEELVAEVARNDESYRVSSESPAFSADVSGDGVGPWSVVTGLRSREAVAERIDGEIHVTIEGERFRFAEPLDDEVAGAGGAARAEVKAPMPGKVVKLLVAEGDAVAAGQGVLLFEAMKMQNEIRSPQDGTMGELHVSEGQAVEARDRLFVVLGT